MRSIQLPTLVRHLRPRFRKRGKPGARPGTVIADPHALQPTINVLTYDADHFEEHRLNHVDELAPVLADDRMTWVDIDGLGDASTIEKVGELFNIHGLVQEDIVNVHQRAKVEEYDDHLFIVARMVQLDVQLQTEQISLILGDNFVITFQERPGDCLDPVRHRLRNKLGIIRERGADYLTYALLDAILDGYFPVLENYGDQLDSLEEQLLERPKSSVIARIHRMRSEFFILRKSIWPHREMVNALMRESTPRITDETRIYLRDCYDHALQLIDLTDTSREIASDLRDFNLSQISMRQNDIMKVLTITATIFIPLNFIAALYGMNFDSSVSPWNMPELKFRYGYPMALGFMLAAAVGLLAFFQYRGWLGRDPTWQRAFQRRFYRRAKAEREAPSAAAEP
ncbi:MAG: magnesium/cobalt transporter CorA [Planctomycetaceae bacterium]|nr:magnesium/cobalt transporter CorA [Planctomycetaceae bacterium]